MTVLERVREVIRMISVDKGAIRDMVIKADEHKIGSIFLSVSFSAPDSTTGTLGRFWQMESLDADYLFNLAKNDDFKSLVAGRVYDLVRRTYLHERDEAFRINGHRVFDPHAGEDGKPRNHMATWSGALGLSSEVSA